MKKLLSGLFPLALTTVLLAGCGGGSSNNDNAPADTTPPAASTGDTVAADTGSEPVADELTTENITLTVWESLGGPDQFMIEAGRRFTEMYPNIAVEFVNVEIGSAASQMALDGPAGIGADVFVAPHDALGELVMGGLILPTRNPQDVANQVLSSALTSITFDGTVYGYPVAAETYALFYNRDLISEDEVPTTFEELVEWTRNFNENTPSDQFGFMFDVANAYYTIIFTTAYDNRLFGPYGTDRENSNINSPASVEGMEFFQSLRDILDVPAGDMTTAIADAAFASGNSAMHLTGPWNVMPFSEQGVNFGITTIPSLPGNNTPAASFSGTRVAFTSAFSMNPVEASAFANFLISEEMQKLRFEITGALPAIPVELDDPFVNGFIAQLEYAFPMPSIPEMSRFWDALGAASSNIWNGADVQAELDAANSAMTN